MEKIILKGKETNLQLMNILKSKNVKYSHLDNKAKLLERVNDYNNSIDVVEKISKEVKDESVRIIEEKKEIIVPVIPENFIRGVPSLSEEEISEYKLYTGSQYCNIKGVNKRVMFFINKKYKNETHTNNEWDEIFIKEKLV